MHVISTRPDLYPLSGLDELNADVLKLRLKDMHGFMYVPLKHCQVTDKGKFLKVFNIVLKKKNQKIG